MRWWIPLVAGCALTSRSEPLEVRYFSPVPATPAAPGAAAVDPSTALERDELPRVRIGSVRPSEHLREDIARRISRFEVELYSTRRWTEAPEDYVRRALADALFDERPLVEAVSGPAVTLQVEILAFEEVAAPRSAGRVQLKYRLDDERSVIESGEITVERPATGSGFVPVVAAIGEALEEATTQLADRVLCTVDPDRSCPDPAT